MQQLDRFIFFVQQFITGVLMKSYATECRRDFLKTTLAGGIVALTAGRLIRSTMAAAPAAPVPAAAAATPTRVALTNGDNRTDNVFRALKALEKEIAAAIGNRRVVIKPNNVSTTSQLAATHVDALIGILDFLKSIGKGDNVLIAESSTAPAMQGFQNFRYTTLVDKYKVQLMDLDQDKFVTVMAIDQSDARPRPVRVSEILTNQKDNFIISACMPKTHNYAVATMSIKNIILGSALKLPRVGGGGGNGRGGRGGGGGSDKPTLHGGGAYGINLNLAMLAPMLHPSLAVIDGFEGMEGNGPMNGTKVDHRICVVSTDYLAADVVGANLMGLGLGDVGYLTYLASAKVGESDLTKMEIIGGGSVEKLARKYQLGPSAQTQMGWKNAARIAPA
jgi:uncharacterized protein (DUF362 family)